MFFFGKGRQALVVVFSLEEGWLAIVAISRWGSAEGAIVAIFSMGEGGVALVAIFSLRGG